MLCYLFLISQNWLKRQESKLLNKYWTSHSFQKFNLGFVVQFMDELVVDREQTDCSLFGGEFSCFNLNLFTFTLDILQSWVYCTVWNMLSWNVKRVLVKKRSSLRAFQMEQVKVTCQVLISSNPGTHCRDAASITLNTIQCSTFRHALMLHHRVFVNYCYLFFFINIRFLKTLYQVSAWIGILLTNTETALLLSHPLDTGI